MSVTPSPFRGDAAPSLSRERERAGVRALPTTGLSAHAQALWRRAARYRQLADTLDAPHSTGAPRP
jgi:hypothetical protein